MGIENPVAIASVNGNNVGVQVEKASEVISVGTPLTYTASVGLVPANQMRRGFLYYVERERVHYRRPYLTYVSWYDLVPSGGGQNDSACTGRINTIGTQLVTNRGVVFDAFLWDDNWDNVNGLVWNISSTAFPSQFANMKSGGHVIWFIHRCLVLPVWRLWRQCERPSGGQSDHGTKRQRVHDVRAELLQPGEDDEL